MCINQILDTFVYRNNIGVILEVIMAIYKQLILCIIKQYLTIIAYK